MNWEIVTWLIIFAVCLIVEIISLGLTTIWACGGALVAMIIAFFGGCSLPLQIVVFLVVTTILFFTTRPIAKKHLDNKLVKTNVESLIGKHVIVSDDIDNLKSKGQVMINGVEWTARSKSNNIIPTGTEVVICEISGVKAIVEQADR